MEIFWVSGIDKNGWLAGIRLTFTSTSFTCWLTSSATYADPTIRCRKINLAGHHVISTRSHGRLPYFTCFDMNIMLIYMRRRSLF